MNATVHRTDKPDVARLELADGRTAIVCCNPELLGALSVPEGTHVLLVTRPCQKLMNKPPLLDRTEVDERGPEPVLRFGGVAVRLYEDLWERYPRELGWSLYPSAAAVVLAAELGAAAVDVDAEKPVDRCEGEVLVTLAAYLTGARQVAVTTSWSATAPAA